MNARGTKEYLVFSNFKFAKNRFFQLRSFSDAHSDLRNRFYRGAPKWDEIKARLFPIVEQIWMLPSKNCLNCFDVS